LFTAILLSRLHENAHTCMPLADADLAYDSTGAPVNESVKVELVPVVCSIQEKPCQDVNLTWVAVILSCTCVQGSQSTTPFVEDVMPFSPCFGTHTDPAPLVADPDAQERLAGQQRVAET
jgi:hypothetical protein